jgi:hypothetical protein
MSSDTRVDLAGQLEQLRLGESTTEGKDVHEVPSRSTVEQRDQLAPGELSRGERRTSNAGHRRTTRSGAQG